MITSGGGTDVGSVAVDLAGHGRLVWRALGKAAPARIPMRARPEQRQSAPTPLLSPGRHGPSRLRHRGQRPGQDLSRDQDHAGQAALKGIDLKIPRGSIFGLLGPNGAGKSTFINILAGLMPQDRRARCAIWGRDIDERPRDARAAIGVVPQEIAADVFFTPRESLEVQAGLYGVPKRERRTDELLGALGLADKADAYVRQLSGGMKRRLMVAKAMVHNPPVLILDEPTAGVDVELRRQLWAYVLALNRQGVTIVLTTHYLEEAEELCDTIAIINRGEVVACEPTSQLLRRLDTRTVVVTPAGAAGRAARPRRASRPGCAPDGDLAVDLQDRRGRRRAGAGRRARRRRADQGPGAPRTPTWRTSSCPSPTPRRDARRRRGREPPAPPAFARPPLSAKHPPPSAAARRPPTHP